MFTTDQWQQVTSPHVTKLPLHSPDFFSKLALTNNTTLKNLKLKKHWLNKIRAGKQQGNYATSVD